MDELIAELEKTEAGSRELDAQVAVGMAFDLPKPMGDSEPWLKLPHKVDELKRLAR